MPIPAGGLLYAGRDEPTYGIDVQAAFGADLLADPTTWSWTDLSARLTADSIRLRAGRSGGADRVSPGTCTATLLNDDGALTPLHPMSPYWPNVQRGTPVRVSLRRVEDAFGRTVAAGWGTTDSDLAWSGYGAGGTIAPTDQSMSGGVARQSVPVAGAYRTSWLPGLSLLDCRVRLSGVSLPFTDVTDGSVEPGNILLRAQSISQYYLARVEVTTAEAVLCKLYNPSGVELASATVAGLTHSAAQTLEVVAEIVGSTLQMKVWATGAAEPAGWAVTATDTTLTVPGGIGVRTGVAGGNTNVKPVVASYDSITVYVDRFSGFADQWEPTYETTTTPGQAASMVRVTASGLLRRLDQGAKPAVSAPARYIPTTNPVAYWPLEDGQLVSEGAALVGGQPMRPFTGAHPSGAVVTFAQWGRGELAPWLPEAVSRGGNRGLAIIWAPVRMPATGGWAVDFIYRSGTDAGDSAVDINPSYLAGSLGWPQLMLLPEFRGVDVAMNGEPEVTGGSSTLFDGRPHHVRWHAFQSGSQVEWAVYVDGDFANGGTTAGAMTLPAVTSIALTAGAQAGADIAQGHVAVWASPPPLQDAVAAAHGHPGETAATRIARLCAEEGITVSVGAGESEPLGPQGVAGLMELLREAEAADMGVLYELGYGLGYRPRGGRYNRPVAMTVDLADYRVSKGGGRDVLSPVYDDQDLRNEWTVGRRDGTEVTARDTAHQAQSGLYSDSVELNVATDDRLPDHASWRVHLGTVEVLREQTFPLDLAANPELIDGWLSCGVGSRLVRTNPPAPHQPEGLDRLVEGWTETIGPRSWLVQVTPSPAAPWDVAVADGPQRAGADGSTLAAALGAESPETINDNPYALVDLSGWAGLNASILRSTSTLPPVDGAVASFRIEATAAGSGGANASSPKAVDPALTYWASLWAWSASALSVGPAVDWRDASGVYMSTTFVPHVTLTPGLWTPITGAVTPPAGAAMAQMRARHDGTTPLGAVWHAWAPRLVRETSLLLASTAANGVWTTDPADFPLDVGVGGERVTLFGISGTTSPQTAIVADRGVNGVQRAWPAGTAVDVWAPAIAPL